MSELSVLVLAAGKGTRMKSELPKVLHPVAETPMIVRVLKTVLGLRPKAVGMVVGHEADRIIQRLSRIKEGDGVSLGSSTLDFIWQRNPKGSGHAVQMAARWIKKNLKSRAGSREMIILCGDTPLIRRETLQEMLRTHRNEKRALTICTMRLDRPFGYGRIAKDSSGRVRRIVEEKDASEAEKRIQEVNTGIYCFDPQKLLGVLFKLKNNNAKGEYYLTDTIEHFHQKGYSIGCFSLAGASHSEAMGVNTRGDLAAAERLLQQRILDGWMDAGVTILNPQNTYVGEEVKIGTDTVLLPGTMLLGRTRIGAGCKIGPNSFLEDAEIADGVTVRASFVYGSKVGQGCKIGPFSHIRPGTAIEPGARVGNFSEIKNSRIGRNSKVSHLSYIGDALLGEDVNVGAGAITCNFDGKKKHKTVIGSKTFIGSNVNLVAPVKIGAKTVVGAGSTLSRDVPPDSLAIERAPQVIKRGWTKGKI